MIKTIDRIDGIIKIPDKDDDDISTVTVSPSTPTIGFLCPKCGVIPVSTYGRICHKCNVPVSTTPTAPTPVVPQIPVLCIHCGTKASPAAKQGWYCTSGYNGIAMSICLGTILAHCTGCGWATCFNHLGVKK